ncbi:MAG: hydrogenase nickel incorporation protein HypB [Lachnospiraceae bacterium]|nr:hydrogenase nickel incorporation protein HypB [Lachnospiraceae bacterium]
MAPAYEILETKERILEKQNTNAAENRDKLTEQGVFFINLMSSPGAGKTTTLLRTIRTLGEKYRIGVMEADVDSDVDAAAVAQTGAHVIQLHSSGSCHMAADMTWRGVERLGTDDLDVLFLENIGNLVCPAEFDVGAHLKVMLLSVPEGDDKPLKYPLMFSVSDVLLINKIDTAQIFDFDFDACEKNAREKNPRIEIVRMSAATGEGFDDFISLLDRRIRAFKENR